MTPQPENQNNELPLVLKKLLCLFVSYFDGELKQFYLDSKQSLQLKANQKSDKVRPVVIVSRDFYIESAKKYPVENKSELKKLLVLEYQGKTFCKQHIWPQKEGLSPVNSWQYDTQVPVTLITLPESLLIALGNQVNQVAKVAKITPTDKTKSMFVSQQNDLVHSLFSNSIINSTQRFSQSIGAPNDLPTCEIENESLASALSYGFSQKLLSIFPSFINSPSRNTCVKTLKKILIPSSVLFGVYMLVSSVYLFSYQYWLHNDSTQQADNLDLALQQQQQYDQNFERYVALKDFLQKQKNSAGLWLVLSDILEDSTLTYIRIENGRYVLRGSAKKSTDVLEKISKHPLVSDAKFDFPTRNSRGEELYVIGFGLAASANLGLTNTKLAGSLNDGAVKHDG